MKRIYWITLMMIGSLFLVPVRPAAADAAPPWYAQGASVENSESMTQVQMVSEEVLLVVEERPGQVPVHLTAESMVGHVEATFVMRNQGTVEEAFDVWFPLGMPEARRPFSDTVSFDDNQGLANNFAAWVDGVPVDVSQQALKDQWDHSVQWATWPAVFPPGQDVILRVTYDVLPVGWDPYGTFYYVLQTGAGWWGPIQEGTVTFRLPYEVDSSNTVHYAEYGQCFPDVFIIEGEQMTVEWNGSGGVCSPNPSDWTISGTDVTWQFTDLEPTRDDNVYLTVLAPEVWRQIQAAQQQAVDTDSPQTHLHLARTLASVIRYRNVGPELFSPNTDFAAQADLAYRRALELAPQSGKVYVEYLEFMVNMWSAFEPLPDNWFSVLERAWELSPGDERLLRSVQQAIGDLQWAVQVCPIATPDSTPATPTASAPSMIYTPLPLPTERATAASPPDNTVSTSTPSPSPPPVSTLSPTPTPFTAGEATSTLVPAPTLIPSPTNTTRPTLAPTSAPMSDSGRRNLGDAFALALLCLAVFCGGVIYYRKRRGFG